MIRKFIKKIILKIFPEIKEELEFKRFSSFSEVEIIKKDDLFIVHTPSPYSFAFDSHLMHSEKEVSEFLIKKLEKERNSNEEIVSLFLSERRKEGFKKIYLKTI